MARSSRQTRSFSASGVHAGLSAFAVAATVTPSSVRKRERLPDHVSHKLVLCARHADVEQAPLFGDLLRRARLLRRQLLLLQARDEDRLELEPLRAMQREQVDATRAVAARVEPPTEVGDERRGVTVELGREPNDPREVGLPHHFALAELVGELLQPAGVQCRRAHRTRRVVARSARGVV